MNTEPHGLLQVGQQFIIPQAYADWARPKNYAAVYPYIVEHVGFIGVIEGFWEWPGEVTLVRTRCECRQILDIPIGIVEAAWLVWLQSHEEPKP